MTLKVRVNDLHFQYQLRVFQDACANLVILDQICDELSCEQGNVYGQTEGRTGGRTDGQIQATTIPLRPERPLGKNWTIICNISFILIKRWLNPIKLAPIKKGSQNVTPPPDFADAVLIDLFGISVFASNRFCDETLLRIDVSPSAHSG